MEDLVTGVPDPTGIALNVSQPTLGKLIPLSIISPNDPTIVITHGWQPKGDYNEASPPIPFLTMAIEIRNSLFSKGIFPNIFAYTWKEAFTHSSSFNFIEAKKAGAEGVIAFHGSELAVQFVQELGANYSSNIHFIGHSYGTLVNTYAANILMRERSIEELRKFTA